MPLRLHAITLADGSADEALGDGRPSRAIDLSHIAFRELSAVVSDQPSFAPVNATTDVVAKHRAIVDAAFRRGAVLPAPVGVVFRSIEVLSRWIELHYVTLTGALEFVEDRSAARVHMVRADGKLDDHVPDTDLAAQAAEAARAIRRRAVAGMPLRPDPRPDNSGLELGSAFLVETVAWNDFIAAVAEQQDAHHLLRFEVTGPWAPYDFVRMQFGG
ncbi:MAG TPA: GvpL/GvpF family gas vesicle protein [Gemmatimonadaceae bacterium]|jgi:hypothetical protein|nr:GvpL/GvpF family gas vesicle protein [Gemmatimonadaceae bacterium]